MGDSYNEWRRRDYYNREPVCYKPTHPNDPLVSISDLSRYFDPAGFTIQKIENKKTEYKQSLERYESCQMSRARNTYAGVDITSHILPNLELTKEDESAARGTPEAWG